MARSNSMTQKDLLTRGQLLAYSSGNFGKAIVWNTLELFFIFYLTDLAGLAPSTAGLLILITLVWDAVLDPVIGLAADRTRSPLGKYGPYILIGAPISSLSFILIFFLPELTSGVMSLPLAVVSLLIFRTGYTLIDLPHNALLARISTDSHERSTAAIMRFFFSSLATLTISASSILILTPGDSAQQAQNFQAFAIVASLLSALAMWASWWRVRDRDRHAPYSATSFNRQITALSAVLKNQNALILLWVAFITALSLPIFAKALSYFGKYNLKDEGVIGYALTAMMLGQIVSTLGWAWLTRRTEKATALRAAHLVIAAAVILFAIFANEGGLILLMLTFCVGLGAGGVYSIIWGMAPDVIDDLEDRIHVRAEATFISVVIVLMKLAIAFGFGLFGLVLDVIGYQANLEQSDMTLLSIQLSMCLLPLLGALACVISLSAYSITHETHRRIIERIGKSRTARTANSALKANATVPPAPSHN